MHGTGGETNRSNIRIKVFVHRCSNFVSLFELFVPLAHAQNNLRSKKKPVLALDVLPIAQTPHVTRNANERERDRFENREKRINK